MDQNSIPTRSLSEGEKLLRQKFYESMAGQSDLMDKVAERLLTLELAIPGLYAAVLKLISGDAATVTVNKALYLTFACWLAALVCTLLAIIPKKWQVDPTLLKQDSVRFAEGLGLEDFFMQSASYKRRLIVASSVLFFAGVAGAIFTLG